MTEITQENVLEALKEVNDPLSGKSIVEEGRLSSIFIKDSKVIFSINAHPDHIDEYVTVRSAITDIVEKIDGVESSLITLTAEKGQDNNEPQEQKEFDGTANIKNIILVASGKGGVGKSTVASNLAATFALDGKKVGLFDADIYGASQPRMMGCYQKPETDEKGIIQPPIVHENMKFMSLGLLVNSEDPIIWRGPKIHGALNQLLKGVNWGDLDLLVVDMPPGTGDVQLSIANLLDISGAVIVSTPQEVALVEARKAVTMFSKVNIPTLGIVENMSYYLCPNCGERDEIFDNGRAQQAAREMSVEFLGEIPINSGLRLAADKGTPFVLDKKEDDISAIYKNLSKHLLAILNLGKSCKYSQNG